MPSAKRGNEPAPKAADGQPKERDPTPGAAEQPHSTTPQRPTDAGGDSRIVPRVISFIMLAAVVLLVAVMFFRVMAQFIAPLFLAAVLVVIFEPLHKRVMRRFPGKPHLSAIVTTALVALVVLIPTTWLALNAYVETVSVVGLVTDDAKRAETLGLLQEKAEPSINWYEKTFQKDFGEQWQKLTSEGGDWIAEAGLHTLQSLVGFLFGLGIMGFAMFYFFADGPDMIDALMKLSPLDDAYERELLEKFAEVSRAVVVATLLSAAAQGLLAGVGYYAVLDGGPIFLLTAATMLMAIVPFIGATAVWAPVVLWVYFYQGDTTWAIGLFLWCAIAVSNIDNIIKPYVLHGQSNLHPLLALLSVLGGVTAMGPVGILVGPMLVAFLQALLNMLRKELDILQGKRAAADTPRANAPSAATA
ncbi:MAG: AI-2E family transporter [Planctomycetota bacterium]